MRILSKPASTSLLLIALSLSLATPVKAQIFMGKDSARQSQKAAKKEQKAQNKAARKQLRAQKKYEKGQRKAAKQTQRRA